MNLPNPPLLLITDRTMIRTSLDEVVGRAFDGGCRWVMIREKDLKTQERLNLVETILKVAEPYKAKVLVNSDLQAAKIADGVHIPQGQSCKNARLILGPDKVIGISAHTADEIRIGANDGANYATISPIFASLSKPDYGPLINLEGLRYVVSDTNLPIIGLGGITEFTAYLCRCAGASGIAVMGAIMRSENPSRTFNKLLEKWYGN